MGYSSHEPWIYLDEDEDAQADDEDMLTARHQEHEARLATVLQRYHLWRCTTEAGCSCEEARTEFAAMAEETVTILARYYDNPTTFSVTDLRYF